MTQATVADLLSDNSDALTRAERQLAAVLLDNYPISGLGTITELAAKADVSAPTVMRLVQKIGFRGFSDYQAALRHELEARISSPIAKQDGWAATAPQTHILNRFTEAVTGNIRQTLNHIDPVSFDAACGLLADHDRHLYIAGGRITGMLASHLFLHMQVARPGVTLIEASSNTWPHHLLNIKEGDVLAVFDIRRYEVSTLKLAEVAAQRGARLILFTDQWRSPAARVAHHCFPVHISVPSAWDSTAAMVLLVETMISAVVTATWDTARERMEALEGMFDATGLFRKFK